MEEENLLSQDLFKDTKNVEVETIGGIKYTEQLKNEEEQLKKEEEYKKQAEEMNPFEKFVAFKKEGLDASIFNFFNETLTQKSLIYDNEFIQNPELAQNILNEYDLDEDKKNELLEEFSTSEYTLRNKAEREQQLKEEKNVLNQIQGGDALIYGLGSTLTDATSMIAYVKAFNVAQKLATAKNLGTGATFGTHFAIEGLTGAGIEGIHKSLKGDENNLKDLLVTASLSGIIGGTFGALSKKTNLNEFDQHLLDIQEESRTIRNNIDEVPVEQELVTGKKLEDGSVEYNGGEDYDISFSKVRFDTFKTAWNKTKNSLTGKNLVSYFFKDPVTGKKTQSTTFVEQIDFKRNTKVSDYSNVYLKDRQKFYEENINNYNSIDKHLRVSKLDDDFNKELYNYGTRVENGNISIDEVPEMYKSTLLKHKEIMEEYRQRAIKEGLGMPENAPEMYIPREWNGNQVKMLVGKHGKKNVETVLYRSIENQWIKNGTEITKETRKVIKDISKNIIRKIYNSNPADFDDLKTSLKLESEIAKHLNKLPKEIKESQGIKDIEKIISGEGKSKGPGWSKNRLKLDNEYFDEELGFGIKDMLNTHFSDITTKHIQKRESYLGLKEIGRLKVKTNDGKYKTFDLSTDEGVEKILNQLRKEGVKEDDIAYFKKQFGYLKTGIIEEEIFNGTGNKIARMFRNWNLTQLASVFLSTATETGNLTATVGVKNLMKSVPEFKRLNNAIKNGSLTEADENMLKDIYIGINKDKLNKSLGMRLEEENVYDTMSETTTFLDKANRFFSNVGDIGINKLGMLDKITSTQRSFAVLGYSRHIFDKMFKGKSLNESRIKELGFTKEEYEEVTRLVREHSKQTDDVSTILNDAKTKWNNETLYDKLRFGIIRKSESLIMETHQGETMTIIQSNPLWKSLFQFSMWSMNSHGKLLLNGLSHNDAEFYRGFMASIFAANIAYQSRVYMTQYGNEEKRKEMLSPKMMVANTLSSSAYAGMTPRIVDQVLKYSGYDPLFTRVSGTPTQGVVSNPTFNKIDAITSLPQEIIESIQEGKLSPKAAYHIKNVFLFNDPITAGVMNLMSKD